MKDDFTVKESKRKCSAIPVDQALDKEYNKNAKAKGGIIGFTREKEGVAKWSIINYEKMQYFRFFNDLCNLSSESEYSLHHEYSSSATGIYFYIKERMNLFSLAKNHDIVNIPMGFLLMQKKKILLGSDGNKAYNNFVII